MKCVLSKGEAVAIGRLERFVADWEAEHGRNTEEKIKSNGKKGSHSWCWSSRLNLCWGFSQNGL